jgi:hypothetical protein
MFGALVTVALVSGNALTRGALTGGKATNRPVGSPDIRWERFHDDRAGLEIAYPAHWRLEVAQARRDSSVAREHTVLLSGELHKFTFVEPDTAFWPGYYQIRVLANPDTLDLGAFFAKFDRSDLWNGSLEDTLLAGAEAKTWIRWGYDALLREHLLVSGVRVVHVVYEEHNSNDPAHTVHLEIYQQMTGTLRVSR